MRARVVNDGGGAWFQRPSSTQLQGPPPSTRSDVFFPVQSTECTISSKAWAIQRAEDRNVVQQVATVMKEMQKKKRVMRR